MILGFEVEQLCLDLDIIYDRLFLTKKESYKRDCFLPCLVAKEHCLECKTLSYGYLCFNKETT